MHLMATITNIMVKNLDTMDTGTILMHTDMAITEGNMVTLERSKDIWILAGLDRQLTHIMEKDGPTALAMESNPY